MKKRSETYQKWINAAYEEFATKGPDFSLKALSLKTGLPRATFYYYFDNKKILMDELLNVHQQSSNRFCEELKTSITSLIPDLYVVMYNYKEGVRFQQQLLRNQHIEQYYTVYCSIHNSCIQILLPFIKAHFKLNCHDRDIITFYNTLTDAWYSRVNCNNLSVESMTILAISLMDNIASVLNE